MKSLVRLRRERARPGEGAPDGRRSHTDVLVIGLGRRRGDHRRRPGAGRARRSPWSRRGPGSTPTPLEPFSLEEMVAKYRHHGLAAALGNPAIAYAEGRCVGGSTEINSGLYHRLPDHLADEWRATYAIDEFIARGARPLRRPRRERAVAWLGCRARRRRRRPLLERGATKLGLAQRRVRPGLPATTPPGRGTKQTMSRTHAPPGRGRRGDRSCPTAGCCGCCAGGDRVVGARCRRTHPAGGVERPRPSAPTTSSCAAAPSRRPALLQRSGIRRNIGTGLKLHPTIKIAARFPPPGRPRRRAHAPHHRVRPQPHHRRLGQPPGPRRAWPWPTPARPSTRPWPTGRTSSVYYAAIRSDGSGRVIAVPGLRVAARHLPAHRGRPQPAGPGPRAPGRGAAGGGRHRAATRRWSGGAGRPPRRRAGRLVGPRSPAPAANLMTVHLTSTRPHGREPGPHRRRQLRPGPGYGNLRVNDASLLPDAPGVNPQAAIMAIAARNADHFRGRAREAMPTDAERDVPWHRRRLARPLARGRPAPRAGWGRTWSAPWRRSGERVRCLVPTADEAAAAGGDRRPRSRSWWATSATRPPPTACSTGWARRRGVPRRRRDPPRALDPRVLRRQRRRHPARARPGPPGRRPPASCTCRPTRRSAPTRRPTTVFTEDSPYDPYMGYGRSKHEAEQLVQQAHDRGDVPTVIVRAPWFYGPYQPARQSQFFSRHPQGPVPARRRRHASGARWSTPTTWCRACCGPRWPRRRPGNAYWVADAEPYELREIIDTVAPGAGGRGPADVRAGDAAPAPGRGTRGRAVDAAPAGPGPLRRRPLHVLGELKATPSPATSPGPAPSWATSPRSPCARACGPASAGASTTGSSSVSTDRPGHRRQRLLRVDPGRAGPRPGRPRAHLRPQPAGRPGRRASSTSQGDVRDLDALREACDGVDVVLHNVAQVPLAKDHDLFWSVNVIGTANVLLAARDAGVARSCTPRPAPSSASPSPTRSTEDTPGRPLEAYGRAKLEAELLCRDAAAGGLDVIDRPAPHHPRPRPARHHRRPVRVRGRGRARLRARAGATTATSSCTPTTWPTPACGPPTARSRPTYNIGATEFGTMRETLQALVDHAGTGSRVRSLPAGPARAGMKGLATAGPGALRPLPLAALRRVAVVRHHPGPGRAGLDAAALQRLGRHRVLRVVPRPPRRRWRAATGSHHQSPVKLGLLKLLKRLP